MTTNPPPATAARRSLEALALGDAFGERWFPLLRERRQAENEIRRRRRALRPVDGRPPPGYLAAALRATAEGFSGVDTTCAITGGVVGAATGTAGAPGEGLRRREPLG
ncbi:MULTISPECIES: hypothetical protein [Streptomyces]|uniref:hypothetical protein n=1 Tax=Streptomyces sp. CS065A TaxID=2162708 RepID=UPI001CEFA025|nr:MULTISPECIES: hypothetical protein [Streptomyces]